MDLEERLEYLEYSNDNLRMQNRVLAVAFKALLQSLPHDIRSDAIENINDAWQEEGEILEYEQPHSADLFHDTVNVFFQDKR